ncbi:MAG: DUF1836 domain-containing protein [Lachnospiraceae bacterium]|nr:DUF1836 domain-containing protein [Lachnospiraceae bacterium]
MNQITKQRLRDILSQINSMDYIEPDAIPDIPLYMDQVTTFMDKELASCKRYPEDKLLTKTMINNYTKNDLLPPPEKKKYSKDHLYLLTFIYYLKSFLSIGDIQKILHPLIARFHEENAPISLEEIYEVIYHTEQEQSKDTAKDIIRRYLKSGDTFTEKECAEEDRDYLQFFSFICMLSFDIYVKKQIIEHLVDLLPEESEDGKKKSKKQS